MLPPAFSHAQATIYGKITDTLGIPIPDVKVATPKISGRFFSTLSDKNGAYTLLIPSDTTILIQFTHISFGISFRIVKLLKGQRENVNMSINTTKSLNDVVVEDKANRSNFIQSIPTKDIYVQSGASGDFNVILFTQLGVQQSNELSSSYSVRGGNFDENLVYVNDIEVYRPFLAHSGQQEGLSFVNSDLVSSINFSSGGFEARYGDKMSSVLDIRYKKPREFAGSISGGLLGGAIHLEGASKDKRFTYLLGAREKTNSYLLNSLDTKGEYKPLFYDIQSYFTYNPTDEWEHDILVNIGRNKYWMIPQSRKSSFGTVNTALQLNVYFAGQELDNYKTITGAYSAIYRPHGKDLTLKIISSAYHTLESETFDILGQYYLSELENDFSKDDFGKSAYSLGTGGLLNHARNYLDANVYSLEHKGNKIWKDANRQMWWGVKYQREIINDDLSEWRMIDSAGHSIPNGTDSTGYVDPTKQLYNNLELYENVKSKNQLSSNRYSGYIQHAWNWDTKDTGRITLTMGVRSNYWDINKQLLISPRSTIAFKPNWNNDVLFKFSSGYYYQPPFYRELRDPLGNLHTDVKAQRSIHFVLGTDYNYKAWKRPFKFICELYYKYLDHLNPYELDNVRIRYFAKNNAVGYATGIDMKVNGQFVKGIDSWASLSIMKTMENIKDDSASVFLNSDGQPIIPGYTSNNIVTDTVLTHPGYIPRPTDQRVTFSLFFQDYLPKLPRCKMHINLLFGTGLPFGPPTFQRYKDILRMPMYRRVDIGFSYQIVRDISSIHQDDDKITSANKKGISRFYKSIWFSLEVYNLLAVNNVVSYTWVRDVNGRQYAVPDYLSSRLLNARIMIKF